MNSTQTWKALLGFTERFAVIDQLASLLKQDPEVQHSQALKSAQGIETECFNSAILKEDYIHLWKTKLQELQDRQHGSASPPFSPATPANGPATPGITLGAYFPCHHTESGLFSTIYRAPHPAHLPPQNNILSVNLSTYVALKFTNPSITQPPHDPNREARILTTLKGHDNIVPLLETFTLPPSSFILVFPFFPHTLASLLASPSRPSAPKLVSILRDIASALSWVHSQDILHRDVKPSNILLPSAGSPAYLADFGIAWSPTDAASEPAEEKITDVGTTAYRPPELLFGYRSYGKGLDMWAYGCTVAECFMTPREVTEDDAATTFFDAGDIGSELRLVASIFGKLGTPSVETWPEAAKFPDFGKILFHQFPKKSWEELLPEAVEEVRALVEGLLVYESGERLSAQQVLEHELFRA